MDYDAVPTPVPLCRYDDVRFWRAEEGAAAGERQYSVPVRLSDCGPAVYDNQDTVDRLRSSRRRSAGRCCHRGHPTHASPALGDGPRPPIMRFVELRQVRADCTDTAEISPRQRDFPRYATEDHHYLVSRADTPSSHLYCRRGNNKPEVVYTNVDSAHAPWQAVAGQQASPPAPIPEEATESNPAVAVGEESAASGEPESSSDCYEQSDSADVDQQDRTDEDAAGCTATTQEKVEQRTAVDGCAVAASAQENASENNVEETAGTEQSPKDQSNACAERCRPTGQRTIPDTAGRRPSAQLRLADAFLLRMSPPPPAQQANARHRAAYSDPVRWVAPAAAAPAGSGNGFDRQRHPHADVAPSTPTPRRPNGLRSAAAAGNGRTAAATACTSEALDEAIRRRNRKCKPFAMRRLQAAKAAGGGDSETGGASSSSSSFEPIFEGVACSLRMRSASLNDFNAVTKSRVHTLNF